MAKPKYDVIEGTEPYQARNIRGNYILLIRIARVVETKTSTEDGKTFIRTTIYPLEGAALNEYMERGRSKKSIPEILAKYGIGPEEEVIEKPERRCPPSMEPDYHRKSVKEERLWTLQFDRHLLMDWEPDRS